MKIVVSAYGAGAKAQTSTMFGRCPIYVFVDTETMEYEAVDNPAVSAYGGAGIQGAQFVVEHGAQAVITGNVGPNALSVLNAADIPIYQFADGTVQAAVDAFRAQKLPCLGAPSVPAHTGMPGRSSVGGRKQAAVGPDSDVRRTLPSASDSTRSEEVTALKETVSVLEKQLAEVLEKLDKLERSA